MRLARHVLFCAAVALTSLTAADVAHADPAEDMTELRQDPRFRFCSAPKRPLLFHQRSMCSIVTEVKDCTALATACGEPEPGEKSDPWQTGFLHVLAIVARVFVWLGVAAGVVALLVPVVLALLRARRDKSLASSKPSENRNRALTLAKEQAEAEGETTNAEQTLAAANEHAQRGDNVRALGLYLSATLAALDRRGAIRMARARTNGEYVRSCSEEISKNALRDIVREVDKAQFGKMTPSPVTVLSVASRANAVVHAARIIATMMLVLVALGGIAGCGFKIPSGPVVDDPSGDELPMEVLRKSGYDVSYLPKALAALPMPTTLVGSPVVVVDVGSVALEPESEAHLLRWVEAGGVLVLAGRPSAWPAELKVTTEVVYQKRFKVFSGRGVVDNALAAHPTELKWEGANAFARLGSHMYGARKYLGQGAIVGIAGSELFTNLGVAIPENAKALVALISDANGDRRLLDSARGALAGSRLRTVQFARSSDGIPPPSNPFTALAQSGLGKGAWHALAAALVLFLAYGIRHARAKPDGLATRRAFREHIEATAAFYGRTKALPHALATYGKFAELRIRERLPRGADAVSFLATRTGAEPAAVEAIWKRAQTAKADDPVRGDELKTITYLRSLLARALER